MSQRDFADLVGAFGPQSRSLADLADEVDDIRSWCRATADYYGHKGVAAQLGRPRASLTHALTGTAGHRLYLEDLVWFLANEPGTHLLDALIELRREIDYTPEERAAAALSAARQYLGGGDQHKGYLTAYRTQLRAQRRRAGSDD